MMMKMYEDACSDLFFVRIEMRMMMVYEDVCSDLF